MRVSWVWGLVLLLIGCQEQSSPSLGYHKISGTTMGTYYTITWSDGPPIAWKDSIDNLLFAFNEEVSTYIASSTIGRFNQSATGILIDTSINRDFWENFQLSIKLVEKTKGAFDPTVMPLVNYWGFGYTEKKAVSQVDSQRVNSLLPLIGMDNLHLEYLGNGNLYQLNKNHPDVQLDFSAIAKGFGVDRIAEWLEKKGVNNYLVDIGGEMRSLGSNPKGGDWVIGINEPLEGGGANTVFQTLKLSDKSVATSGNYRNFYELDGSKYSHTISPWTGYPQQLPILSVTVVAPDCATADALATACMVLGHEEGLALIEKIADIEAYFIYNNGKDELSVVMTSGFQTFLKD